MPQRLRDGVGVCKSVTDKNDGKSLLEVRGVSLRVGGMSSPLFTDVCFTVGTGELVALAGDSGAGKSLLAWAVMGLLPAKAVRIEGSIWFRGVALDRLSPDERRRLRGRQMSLLVQDAQSSLDPMRPVGRQLNETLGRVAGAPPEAVSVLTGAWLARVGLPAVAGRYPHELSGGQVQRVALALALCAGPALLIADEPTAGLDQANTAVVVELLRSLAAKQGGAVLLISHDESVLGGADRVVMVRRHRQAASPSSLNASQQMATGFVPRSGPAARSSNEAILRMAGVSHRYGPVLALNGVSLTLSAGEAIAVLGESGSGKSTLARVAAGLLRPNEGSVARSGRVAMVFQDATEALDPALASRS